MSAAGPRPTAFYLERQALTRLPATPTPPSGLDSLSSFSANPPAQGTTQAGDGLRLNGLFAIVVSIYPWTGATLSGAGNLLCWVWNPYQAQWTRSPGLDIDLSDATSTPAYTAPAFLNVSRLGMLINWVASSVTASGGSTDVLVRLDGSTSVGERGT